MTGEEIAVTFKDHENEIECLKHRIGRVEDDAKSLIDLATSVKSLAINMEYMAEEQKKQGERLERLEHEPSDDLKYYKRIIIGCIFSTIIGALIAALLAYI